MLVGDSRQGLDAVGSAEIQRIMREEGVSFDEVGPDFPLKRFRKPG